MTSDACPPFAMINQHCKLVKYDTSTIRNPPPPSHPNIKLVDT